MEETYSPLEENLNSLTHGIGAALSVFGTVLLVVMAARLGDPWKIVSFTVFGVSLTLLYLSSALYHGFRSERWRSLFKMLDHCAIFLLIAGTYTPFLLVNMRGTTGWILFGVIWGLALTGVALKLAFGHRYKILRVVIYLLMGWLVMFASGELLASINSIGFWLLLAGGVTYTLGVVFYLVHLIPFNHAIWHLFVVGGSVCHFLAVYFGVLPHTGA
ncbi:MAG: hemolysin III [Alcanivorax sp.]|nr:hemolysin III [Alcanivorax sp.]